MIFILLLLALVGMVATNVQSYIDCYQREDQDTTTMVQFVPMWDTTCTYCILNISYSNNYIQIN